MRRLLFWLGEGRGRGKGGAGGEGGGRAEVGKAAPPSPPLPSWDPVETLPHCACCQRSPGLYTAAPASRGARRSPHGARRGTARSGPVPEERVPRPGCFRGKALPAPLALGCPWLRLEPAAAGGGRSTLDKAPPCPKRPAVLEALRPHSCAMRRSPSSARASAEGPFFPQGLPVPEAGG